MEAAPQLAISGLDGRTDWILLRKLDLTGWYLCLFEQCPIKAWLGELYKQHLLTAILFTFQQTKYNNIFDFILFCMALFMLI